MNNTLRFVKDEHMRKYNLLCNRPLVPTHYVCTDTIAAMGIEHDIMIMLMNLRWWWFQQEPHPAFHRLTYEFLATLELGEGEGVDRRIRYQMLNRYYESTVGEIERCFKMRPSEIDDWAHPWFHGGVFWWRITEEEEYNERAAHSQAIRHPAIRYAHRLLALSVLGRTNVDAVTVRDLEVLWSMLETVSTLNTMWVMLRHMEQDSLMPSGDIAYGSLITHIAYSHGIDVSRMPVGMEARKLNMSSLVQLGDVENLVYLQSWLLRNEQRIVLPLGTRWTIRKPELWKLPGIDGNGAEEEQNGNPWEAQEDELEEDLEEEPEEDPEEDPDEFPELWGMPVEEDINDDAPMVGSDDEGSIIID